MKDSTFICLSKLAAPNNSDIKREDVEELLIKQYKAIHLDESKIETVIKEFLDFCSNRTELFVPSSVDDKFKFFHRSFFEYFYSRYIHQQSSVEEMYELMKDFDIDSEVFELTVALVKEDNELKYQSLVEYIFSQVEIDFKSSCPDFVAFIILTLSMQTIDDEYYLVKYFEIIRDYPELMINEKVRLLNQRLLHMWIIKSIEKRNENKKEFKNVYELECINYMVLFYSRLKKECIPERILIDNEKYIMKGTDFERGIIRSNIENIPFYLTVYLKYFDLDEAIMSLDINEYVKQMGIHNLTRKKKKELKKGLQVYKACDMNKRRKFFEIFFEIEKKIN